MMMRKITAVYDSKPDAQVARDRLLALGLPQEHIEILDQGAPGYSGASTTSEHKGLWASIKEMFIPDEDRRAYEESIRRGGYLLVASVGADQADAALDALEGSNAVDLERRQEQWRAEGWTGRDTAAPAAAAPAAAAPGSDNASEQVIPIVKESLRVGKREVDQGRVRVRSFVAEEPVHEEVRLREEHVEIERRPVNQPAATGATGDLLRERTVELQETAEEAVVAKEAVVTEELHVRKRGDERVQQVDDTVRHTEVQVDDSRSADRGGPDVTRKKNPPENTQRRP